jgi:hypothetical protein
VPCTVLASADISTKKINQDPDFKELYSYGGWWERQKIK